MLEVVSSKVEQLAGGRLRVVTILAPRAEDVPDVVPSVGAGPERDTVPDRVVRFLIACGPEGAQLSEIQRAVGGNPRTANRQIWTLGTNGADLPTRLRGWVETRGNGRYALSAAAWARLAEPTWQDLVADELRRALRKTLAEIPGVVTATNDWQAAVAHGGDVAAARESSDQALFGLLHDARQANTMYGEAGGWTRADKNEAFILRLQRTAQAYRLALQPPTPGRRLEALEDLERETQAALEALDASC